MNTLLEKMTELKNSKNSIWNADVDASIPIFLAALEKYVLAEAAQGFYNSTFGVSRGINDGLRKLNGSEQEYVKKIFLDRLDEVLAGDFFRGLEVRLDKDSKNDSWGTVLITARL